MTVRRILVLDGHTNQALAVVRSLGRAGHSVLVASHSRAPLAGWSRYCAQRVRLTAQDPAGMAVMRKWASMQSVEVVLPLTERSCVLVNQSRAEWEEAGIVVGCADQDRLGRAFDKAVTIEIARGAGVSVPETCVPSSFEEAEAAVAAARGATTVIKPRFSHAWVDGRFLPDLGCAYVSDPADARNAILSRRQGAYWPLVQRHVPGVGKGAFALCDRGRAIAWFAHERLRDVRPTGSGSSLRRSVPLDVRLQEPAARLLQLLDWHGPAMVEFRDDGRSPPWLMEVNGRFWKSLQLAVDAGVDFPALWLDVLAGHTGERPYGDYRAGLTLRWVWGDVRRLAHIAAGAPAGFRGQFPTLWQGMREVCGKQPPGTRSETWQGDDPWPAIGEWIQGLVEVVDRRS